ncbi:hypothetical protein [Bacteroides acidifaciens]|uniref:hypothetical protein n=1 Tax=Bacteroides acidifaciens TaxID=85831 RepID=UPI003F68BD5A
MKLGISWNEERGKSLLSTDGFYLLEKRAENTLSDEPLFFGRGYEIPYEELQKGQFPDFMPPSAIWYNSYEYLMICLDADMAQDIGSRCRLL